MICGFTARLNLRDRVPAQASSGFGKHVLAHAEKYHQLMKSEE
jgi:hypothetical protein